MRLKELLLFTTILVLGNGNRYSRVNPGLNELEEGLSDSVFFFIQDICGTDEQLKDSAQSVYSNYMPLLKRGDIIFLGTNNPAQSEVHLIEEVNQLELALRYNREHANVECIPSIGAAIDSFYLKLKQRTSLILVNDLADRLLRNVNVAHVTTVSVDSNKGKYLNKLASGYNLKMEFIGITEKNDYLENSKSFDIFPGMFTQTYDTEVALLDLVGAFGSHTEPEIPSSNNLLRCVQKLQATFTFHTDISSVPRMAEFRAKASKIVSSVTKYFDIPSVKNIDLDDDTCEFNKDQLKDKTQFYGVMYANNSGIGVPTFCMSNMNSYPDTVNKAEYKQAPQVNLQKVIDSFTKWYNQPIKMMCHCFDYENEQTTKIIMWMPLSPTSFAQHIEPDQTAEPFNPYTTAKPASPFPRHFLLIQDVCGADENLKDQAQQVYANYLPLLSNADNFYLGTNNPDVSGVKTISSLEELNKAMSQNRQASTTCTTSSIGATLDLFYLKIKQQSSGNTQNDDSDKPTGSVDVAHVTTISVDNKVGSYLDNLASEYILKMEFVGFTKKHDYFQNPDAFDNFPGNFTQTYDPEVALLDIVNAFGSLIKPVIPPVDDLPRCIKNLQADFTFHTDISSVPRMFEFRAKASKIVSSVTKYFDIPSVKNIDLDDDTCEFNKDQLKDKTQFYGVMYANNSGIGVPTFCMSNMNSYPDTVIKAEYKQAPQVNLQKVIDSFTKWYNQPIKMMCHCFDYENEQTTKIIMWMPLSPTSFAQHIEPDQTAEPFNPYTTAKPASPFPRHFLLIQDVCGADENLKDQAQQVYANYLPLLSNADNFYLGTNNPDVSGVKTISSLEELNKAMSQNRQASTTCTTSSIGATLDLFYLKIKQQSSGNTQNDDSDKPTGSVDVAHVTTISVDNKVGSYLDNLASEYILKMEFVGFTKKHDYFQNQPRKKFSGNFLRTTRSPDAFDNFPGNFTQTYDPEVALLDIVNAFGSLIKPVIPPVDDLPRCIKNLQADFTFHTDISSVPRMFEFRAKASKIVSSVTKYFDIPSVKNIDLDDDTCEFNKDQLKDKTQFYGVMYANNSGIGVPTFCMSNMNSYPDTVIKAEYKQAPQVNLQKVIDSFTKWYNQPIKMMCHCFDYENEQTTKIIMWMPLSPTSLDTDTVSFAGFDVVGFKHIVVPFGFSYDDSPLWQSLVPNREQWTGDASSDNYYVDKIIQDIWTITCRFAGHIKDGQTAEPFNPYTTVKPRIS
uniref:Uncharacterized protein n=1 Tax=Pristionchus pacificus TaxID=54126 RepID=A0A8R1UD83_PRIPA